MGTQRAVMLRGGGIRKEMPAGGAITPGHIITHNASGQYVVHGTAGGDLLVTVALENEIVGRGIDDAYAAGEQVLAIVPQPGSEVNALVGAGAAAIAAGDPLESAGDGTVRKVTTGVVIGYAMEAVDNSAGTSPARIIMEVK